MSFLSTIEKNLKYKSTFWAIWSEGLVYISQSSSQQNLVYTLAVELLRCIHESCAMSKSMAFTHDSSYWLFSKASFNNRDMGAPEQTVTCHWALVLRLYLAARAKLILVLICCTTVFLRVVAKLGLINWGANKLCCSSDRVYPMLVCIGYCSP